MVWHRRRVFGRGVGLIVALVLVERARAAQAAEMAEVVIDNFAFTPEALKVAVGTEVTWVNHDDIPHSIVIPARNAHSHALDTDEKFSYRFEKAGAFDYQCGLHPHMKGRVEVA
jgi:plastocyanin